MDLIILYLSFDSFHYGIMPLQLLLRAMTGLPSSPRTSNTMLQIPPASILHILPPIPFFLSFYQNYPEPG
uniref:Uncharacterized protein n=1 Tax=Rhizophora mucronata TaxID=61149 RepID=A0A2P2N8T2_RHIMU